MFQGRWPNSLALDPKNRLTLPAKLREGEKGRPEVTDFIVGRLEDPCLYLFTPDQHDRFLRRIYDRIGDAKKSRMLKSYVISRFVPVTADAQGRLTLPGWLVEEARIKKDVVLIAQESRLEIWSSESFAALEAEAAAQGIGEILESVFAEEEAELASLRRGNPLGREGNPRG